MGSHNVTNRFLSVGVSSRMIARMEVAEARELARRLLAVDSPQRWDHVQGVAKRSELFAEIVPEWSALGSAAYLHDIGYAAELVDIGFHQVDGARYLRRQGCDEAVVNLVAHHSGAQLRAELIGLGDIYVDEFARNEALPHSELQFCDMTVALDGTPTTVQERLADMRHRHRNNPPMLRYLDLQQDALIVMVTDTWAALDGDGSGPIETGTDQTLSAT